jgi:hypothetical protein
VIALLLVGCERRGDWAGDWHSVSRASARV